MKLDLGSSLGPIIMEFIPYPVWQLISFEENIF
jgi:hypothetical protein